jgi:DNA repair exonuclease SbcCD ATPase subunit
MNEIEEILEIAEFLESFEKAQMSLPSANDALITVSDPEVLDDIIRCFETASNQVKSSPLSLRSADNANYSEVQDLEGRIAKLINEKEYLKGQYDQQKEQDKAFYDNLLAQHNNLNIQYGSLQNQINLLQYYSNNLQNTNNVLKNYQDRAINLKASILRWVDPNANPGNFVNGFITQAALNNLIQGVANNL